VRACFWLVLCSVALAQTPAVKAPPARSAVAAKDAAQDRQVETAIRARLAASKIAEDHFKVHVQGGVATLEGSTGVVQHKGTATRLAKACGARQVVNRIDVSEAAREKAAANLASGRRRVQVKRSEARSER